MISKSRRREPINRCDERGLGGSLCQLRQEKWPELKLAEDILNFLMIYCKFLLKDSAMFRLIYCLCFHFFAFKVYREKGLQIETSFALFHLRLITAIRI